MGNLYKVSTSKSLIIGLRRRILQLCREEDWPEPKKARVFSLCIASWSAKSKSHQGIACADFRRLVLRNKVTCPGEFGAIMCRPKKLQSTVSTPSTIESESCLEMCIVGDLEVTAGGTPWWPDGRKQRGMPWACLSWYTSWAQPHWYQLTAASAHPAGPKCWVWVGVAEHWMRATTSTCPNLCAPSLDDNLPIPWQFVFTENLEDACSDSVESILLYWHKSLYHLLLMQFTMVIEMSYVSVCFKGTSDSNFFGLRDMGVHLGGSVLVVFTAKQHMDWLTLLEALQKFSLKCASMLDLKDLKSSSGTIWVLQLSRVRTPLFTAHWKVGIIASVRH